MKLLDSRHCYWLRWIYYKVVSRQFARHCVDVEHSPFFEGTSINKLINGFSTKLATAAKDKQALGSI